MIKVIPATADMMKDHFDGMEKMTVKAIALVDDGKVIAIGGSYKSACGHVLFMKASDEARKKPKSLLKAAKQFVERYKTVYAYCDMNIEGADRFLKHLGMINVNGDVWRGHH